MARGRKPKPDLTASWDNVSDSEAHDNEIYSKDDERKELGSQYVASQDTDDERPSRATRSKKSVQIAEPDDEGLRRRATELVMPSSPNGLDARGAKVRAQTPHFRLNARSLTSDAGSLQRKAEAERENSIIRPVLAYAADVLRIALNNPIVKYALALWLLIGIGIVARNYLTTSISNALSPVCRLPGVSSLGLPFCESRKHAEIHGEAEFDKLMQAQAQFEDVLTTSANGAGLPLDMKMSEATIRDVRQVVSYSSLPSKNELVFEFGNFINTAFLAGRSLATFNVKIGHAVDRILSTNRWTLNVIEGVAEQDAGRGALSRFVGNNLNIFAPFQPVPMNRNILVDQYLRHTSAIEEQVVSLIDYAQEIMRTLEVLDGHLDSIAGIVARDGIVVEENKEALFAALWTKLGGNRMSVAKLNNQMQLLREVGQYRKLAWAHVSGTILKLQAIQFQLEDLRERVAAPEVVGAKVPLEVHIENINLGIERLEAERATSRRISDEVTGRWQARSKQGNLIDA